MISKAEMERALDEGFAAAMKRPVVAAPRDKRPAKAEIMAAVANEYAAGEKSAVIAKKWGLSRVTVREYARKRGVPVRATGRPKKGEA